VEGREALQTAIAQGVGVGVMAGTEYGGAPGIRRIPLADCQVRMVESLARLADRPPSNLLDALFATEPA
jgi:LysR family transcriptional regulator, low CO2-responsive transcriptional regulator